MLIDKLEKRGLIHPPSFVVSNCAYITIMGSHAYGVADTSVKAKAPDFDYYGFCIPPKEYLFPNLRGDVPGFGTPGPTFQQWQQHHIFDADANKEYDFQIFNIVKYFELCRQNNPNMIDSLFTPINCVIHCTEVGQIVRDNRKCFLSKEAWAKFRGYSHAQLHKMESKNPEGGRKEIVDRHGFDTKYAYHLLRLLDEVEQILLTGDIDLQRAREPMKAIRRGEWTLQQVKDWAMEKEKALETAYVNCKLPERAPEEKLKQLLLQCLESHYGSLSACISEQEWSIKALKEVDVLIGKYRSKLYGGNSLAENWTSKLMKKWLPWLT